MASRIQSVDLVVGEPQVAIPTQFYTAQAIVPDSVGLDTNLGVAETNLGTVIDTAGWRGLMIVTQHTPTNGAGATRSLFTIRHGDTDVLANHEDVSDDIAWAITKPGVASSGFSSVDIILVDTSRLKRYISAKHTVLGNAYHGSSYILIGPEVAKKSNLDRSATGPNLFVTGSGTLSFPDLS